MFKTDPVPSEKVDAILAAGQHAPSGAHRHPWLFKVITDRELKSKIREKSEIGDKKWHEEIDESVQKWLKVKHITTEKRFLTEAPVLIAVFGDSRMPYWLESVWISIGYMMLAAVDQGLGTVIYTPGDEAFMNEVLKVKKEYKPQVILPIGYPLVEPQSSPTKQTELEYDAQYLDKKIVPGKKGEGNSFTSGEVEAQNNSGNARQKGISGILKITDSDNDKCGCGCGKMVVSLNSRRKFIQGHAKFGLNGLYKILKSPPYCNCGCDLLTEWNWERMTWKKYIDTHIGLRNRRYRSQKRKTVQYDIFDKKDG